MKITEDLLRKISKSKIHPELAKRFAEVIDREARSIGLDKPHRLAHFLAQIAAETGGFSKFKEDLNYSAARLVQVWPTRFRSIAEAKPFERNPKALANKVYNGRMGNALNSNDGWDYSGKDGIQLTGKDNYKKLSDWAGVDFVKSPERLLSDKLGVASLWFWDRGNRTGKSLNQYADINDIEMISRIINGGLNGFDERRDYYDRAALVMLGYTPLDVKGFQRDAKLVVDGLSGARTRAAMHERLAKLSGSENSVRPSPVTEPVKNPELEKPWYKTKEGVEKITTGVVGTSLFKFFTDAQWQNLAIFIGAAGVGIGFYIWNRSREKRVQEKVSQQIEVENVR